MCVHSCVKALMSGFHWDCVSYVFLPLTLLCFQFFFNIIAGKRLSVQSSFSVVSDCDLKDCSMPGFSITNSRRLLKLMSIESVMPSNRLILCCPLLLLPSIFPSLGVFSKESVLRIRWPKYWWPNWLNYGTSRRCQIMKLLMWKHQTKMFINITEKP